MYKRTISNLFWGKTSVRSSNYCRRTSFSSSTLTNWKKIHFKTWIIHILLYVLKHLKKYKCYAPFHWISAAHLKQVCVKRTVSLQWVRCFHTHLSTQTKQGLFFFLCLKFKHSLEGSTSQRYECVKTADFLNGQPMLIYNKLSSPTSSHFLMFYWKSMLQTCFCASRFRTFSLICALRKNQSTAGRKKHILRSPIRTSN